VYHSSLAIGQPLGHLLRCTEFGLCTRICVVPTGLGFCALLTRHSRAGLSHGAPTGLEQGESHCRRWRTVNTAAPLRGWSRIDSGFKVSRFRVSSFKVSKVLKDSRFQGCRFKVSSSRLQVQGFKFKVSRLQVQGFTVLRFQGFRVQGCEVSRFGFRGPRFRVSRFQGFKVGGSRFQVQGFKFKVSVFQGFRVSGFQGFGVQGSRF